VRRSRVLSAGWGHDMKHGTSTTQHPAAVPDLTPPDELERLQAEVEQLRSQEKRAVAYVRSKVDQLLRVIGTLPLRPEELDDATLIALDPIGILAESFAQILEHLHEVSEDRAQARDELQAIFDSAGTAIVVVDSTQRLLACNVRARELFFQSGGETVGRYLPEVFCHPSGPSAECVYERIMRTRSSHERDDFLYGERHFHVVGTPLKDKAGQVCQVVLIYTDITARRLAEQALREAEARLKTILNTVQAGILLIDAETHVIVDANDVAARMIGDLRERLVGSVCHKYVCAAEQGQCPITEGGQPLDNSQRVLLTAAGGRIPVLKTAARLSLNGRDHVVESFIDITASKQAEDALRQSEERYRSLYCNMHEGVALHELVYDASGQPADYVILDVNPSYERILGIPRTRAVGARASALYGAGEPPYIDIFAEVVRSGTAACFETLFDPMQRFFSISATSPAPGQFATIFEDITERRRAEDEMQSLAYLDTLTGLPNRILLQDRLSGALIRAEREGCLVGILFLDLDRFKPINDTLGHAVGDRLLKSVADRLRECVRKSDTVARLGGDEFVLVLTSVQRELDTTLVAQEILRRLAQPFAVGDRDIYSSASIGIAIYPLDGRDADTLLKNADMAMYAAKDQGRNTYQFYTDEMNRRALERLGLETSLRRALQSGELFLQYQPQVDLARNKITGVEALLRWRHPEQGLIPPGRFIPVAEETGLILPVGEWALRAACIQGRAWQDAGLPPLRIAVNLSGQQFKQPGFVDLVQRTLDETGMSPELLELELSESMFAEGGDETLQRLRALKGMGVHVAIDDFGTGYASLSYLRKCPIDRVKIAQTFLRDISANPDDAAIVETILAIARSLALEVIAEGVETAEQFAFLGSRQCDDMQGYYFAVPLLPQDVERLLREGSVPLAKRPEGPV
jgi:diguanylate cyclase (GGDEF)-like protein/PAS domain S-box-containing protein